MSDILIIGATPFDGITARAAVIVFLPLCTGKYDRSAFTDSDAIAVIDTLTEGYASIAAVLQGEVVNCRQAFRQHIAPIR